MLLTAYCIFIVIYEILDFLIPLKKGVLTKKTKDVKLKILKLFLRIILTNFYSSPLKSLSSFSSPNSQILRLIII